MPMLTFSARLGSSSGRTICLHHIVKSCPRSHARGLLGVPTTTRKTPSLGSWPLRLLGSYDLQYYAGSRQANQGIKARTTHTGIISLAASDVRLSSTCKLPATSTLAARDDDCFYTIVDYINMQARGLDAWTSWHSYDYSAGSHPRGLAAATNKRAAIRRTPAAPPAPVLGGWMPKILGMLQKPEVTRLLPRGDD
jgi:hypothetical protein